jgi:hypothetical protein
MPVGQTLSNIYKIYSNKPVTPVTWYDVSSHALWTATTDDSSSYTPANSTEYDIPYSVTRNIILTPTNWNPDIKLLKFETSTPSSGFLSMLDFVSGGSSFNFDTYASIQLFYALVPSPISFDKLRFANFDVDTTKYITKIWADAPMTTPSWVSIFDNTYYNATGQGWWSTDPTPHWGPSGAEVILDPTAAFTNRTYTKIRVTFDGCDTLDMRFTNSSGAQELQQISSVTSLQEINLDAGVLASTGRIYFVDTNWGSYNITNIEYM